MQPLVCGVYISTVVQQSPLNNEKHRQMPLHCNEDIFALQCAFPRGLVQIIPSGTLTLKYS